MILLGGYIEFIMSSYLALANPEEDTTFGDETLSGEVISYYMSGLVLPICLIISFTTAIWIIYEPTEQLMDKEFENKHGILYFDVKYESRLLRASTLMFILRRLFLIFQIVGVSEKLGEGLNLGLYQF